MLWRGYEAVAGPVTQLVELRGGHGAPLAILSEPRSGFSSENQPLHLAPLALRQAQGPSPASL